MLEKLRRGDKVVGARRLAKAIEAGEIQMVYVALDADLLITKKVIELARQKGVSVVEVDSMAHLGEAAGVQVPTAAAGIKKAIV
jgi:ribosomal protein L7Ae-like RNA K-turn-binding protein